MAFSNNFLYTNENGDYQARRLQYAIPLLETPQNTVFRDQELPEMMFDSSGDLIVETYTHQELEGSE